MINHYLIRHTKPKIEPGICYGQTDIELNPNFEKEFSFIKANLPKTGIAVYTSPLERCLKLAHHLSHSISIDARLKEINFGEWELKRWDDIPKEEINPWYGDYVNVCPPKGESFKQLYDRVKDFYDSVLIKQNSSSIIVAHAGPIRILKGISQNKNLHDILKIKVPFGEVLTLSVGPDHELRL